MMWVSSWPRTPSSSVGDRACISPVVTHTVDLLLERPIANALGISLSTIAIRGLGRSAWMHRRSMMACSSGASWGETSLAPAARRASLSEENTWTTNRIAAIRMIGMNPTPAANSTPIRTA